MIDPTTTATRRRPPLGRRPALALLPLLAAGVLGAASVATASDPHPPGHGTKAAAPATTGKPKTAPGGARGAAPPRAASSPAMSFTADRAETERFIAWEREIRLTAEQEKLRVAALGPLPAPCCSEFSAATCCCRCNMAVATWGLAKHLIAVRGASEEAVRTAVAEYHRAINPEGFSGKVCATGGCGRPFAKDGCGGMGPLVF